ncbi:MAG: CBS domain-containing protein [Planctomycetes bacterium]|nr:CBS domain-containing protein [Planctomycetota bacterium]
MPTVEQVLNAKQRRVLSIAERATVVEAAQLMNAEHVGALVVVQGEKVVGIFTERDILNRVVARKADPSATLVKDVMTAPVACCSLQTKRSECRAVMRNRRIRHLPVVEGERLVGIISIGDILEVEGAEQEETIRYLYEYLHGEWK